jgi:hypothetical protein
MHEASQASVQQREISSAAPVFLMANPHLAPTAAQQMLTMRAHLEWRAVKFRRGAVRPGLDKWTGLRCHDGSALFIMNILPNPLPLFKTLK